jgi:hypothetical protein
MTNLLDIILRLFVIKTHNVSETEVSPSSGKRHLLDPIDRASPYLRCLPDDGDRLQSPKRRVF